MKWLRDLGRWIAGWHASLPPATTFAEGQQALMVKLLARAGIAATFIVLGLVAILIWGEWSDANERLIIYIMAGVIAAYCLANLAVLVSFSIGGPVGRIDLEATRNGVKIGASKENERETTISVTERSVGPDAERPGGEGPSNP